MGKLNWETYAMSLLKPLSQASDNGGEIRKISHKHAEVTLDHFIAAAMKGTWGEEAHHLTVFAARKECQRARKEGDPPLPRFRLRGLDVTKYRYYERAVLVSVTTGEGECFCVGVFAEEHPRRGTALIRLFEKFKEACDVAPSHLPRIVLASYMNFLKLCCGITHVYLDVQPTADGRPYIFGSHAGAASATSALSKIYDSVADYAGCMLEKFHFDPLAIPPVPQFEDEDADFVKDEKIQTLRDELVTSITNAFDTFNTKYEQMVKQDELHTYMYRPTIPREIRCSNNTVVHFEDSSVTTERFCTVDKLRGSDFSDLKNAVASTTTILHDFSFSKTTVGADTPVVMRDPGRVQLSRR